MIQFVSGLNETGIKSFKYNSIYGIIKRLFSIFWLIPGHVFYD
jgi:hypothetical protein